MKHRKTLLTLLAAAVFCAFAGAAPGPSQDFVPLGVVRVVRPNGVAITKGYGAANNAARGTALAAAISAATSGDVVDVGGGTFAVTASITVPAGVTIIGHGTTVSGIGLTQPLFIVAANNITLDGLTIASNSYCVGADSTAAAVTATNLKLKDLVCTINDSVGTPIYFYGGGHQNHIVATLTNVTCTSPNSGNGSGGAGCQMELDSTSVVDVNGCTMFGDADGALFIGPLAAVVNVNGGVYTSSLDGLTTGGVTMYANNVKGRRGDSGNADIYSDDGALYVANCDAQVFADNGKTHFVDTAQGSGASLTSLNASNISSGTLAAARIGALGTPTSGTLTNATGLPIASGVSGLGTGVATFLATPSSANLVAAMTDETGTGANVFATSPTLVTPILGTPTSGTLTSCTGLPISTGVSGLGTSVATFLTTPTSANLAAAVTNETGSGALAFATSPTLVTPILGTPSSGTLTSCTGLPISTGVSGLGTGVATALATPSSANFISALTDETGTGSMVFATSPTLVTPVLGTPASGNLSNCTALNATQLTTGTVAAARGGAGSSSGILKADGAGLVSAATADTDYQAINPAVACGRLTTESGVAISTSDRTAQSTIYWTPYLGNRIALYTGSIWKLYTFTERSLVLSSLTSGKNYDVFLFDSSGTLTLELSAAWSSDTARTDALTTQDGILVKSGATTRRYLGTIRTTGTTTTEDSGGGTTTQVGGKRFVWNYYNRVRRHLAVIDTTDNWNYGTNTIRQADGAAGNKVEMVVGDTCPVDASLVANFGLAANSSVTARIGIGVDTITAFSGLVPFAFTTGNLSASFATSYKGLLSSGYHYLSWNEAGANGTTHNFFGDNGGDGSQSGLQALIEN